MRTRKNYIHMKKHTTHLYVGQRVTPRPSPSVTGQPPISGKPFFHPTFLASLTWGAAIWEVVSCHTAQQKEKGEGEKSGKKFLLSRPPPLSTHRFLSAQGPAAGAASNFPPSPLPTFFPPRYPKKREGEKNPIPEVFLPLLGMEKKGGGRRRAPVG